MTDLFDVVRRMGLDIGGTASAVAILLRVTVLLLAAMLVAAGLRRSSAALRHLVWTLSLVGTLLIPLCYWTFPAWQWAILPQRQSSPAPMVAPVANVAMPEAPPQFASSPRPSGAPAVESFDVATARPATVAEPSAAPLAHRATWSWPVFFAVLWAVGTSLGLLWLGIGMAGAWHVARRAEAAADSLWRQLLQQLLAACGFRRPVAVRECPQVSVPMTWGMRRPVILVPAGSAAWSEEAKRSVLLHELGHIRRGDCLMHLLGRLACVAYWFHPLVWLAARQMRKTSEQAADDVVLSSNIAPPAYAEHLVGIAGQMRGLHLFGHVALPMASPSDLEGRVQAILDPRRNHRSLKRKTCYALMLVAALLLIPCALLRLGYAEEKKSPETEKPKQTSPTAETVVAGQVVDSVGKPIAGAQVAVIGRSRTPSTDSLLTDDTKTLGLTRADSEGKFRLPIPHISSAAYYRAYAVAVADGCNLGWQSIGLDDEQPKVAISLTKEQTIHGRVVDAKGEPAVDVKVYVTSIGKSLPGDDSEGIRCWTPPSQLPFWPQPVTTDREGCFTLRGVDRSGILNVQARDDRFAIDWMHLGSAGEKDAHVAISPSGEVTLSPPPARMFEGTVTYDDTHQPVAKARVEISASVDPMTCIMNMAGRTDAEGRFRLNPYSGKIFHVSVYPPDGEPYLTYQKEIKLSDGQQQPRIEIALPRGVLLRGKITEKSSGESVAAAAVKYEDQSEPPYRPDRILPDYAPPPVGGVSRADGTYQIAVPPGRGTLFVQGPGNDYIRQTINTRDFDEKARRAQRHYVAAYASLDMKPNQEPAELNLTIRRGVTVRGRIVGPDNRPVGDVLLLSRHFLGVDEDTFRVSEIIIAVNGQFELHGLDPDVRVPFYFLDPKKELGATVDISGKSGDNGPLVVHLQPCGKAVARFVDPQGKPTSNYEPGLQILVSPGPFRADDKRTKNEIPSDQDYVANFDREHYWRKPVTDDGGRCTFPALIPGATYRFNLMNKPGDWDVTDFTVKSGETLQLPDIVIPTPASKAATDAAAEAKGKLPASDADTGAWQPGQVLDFRAIDARTKEPLSDVTLVIMFSANGKDLQKNTTQTTDAEGRSEIRLPDRRPDAVRVYPSKAGFVPLRVYWGDDLPSPKLPKSVTVPLEPGTVWGGVVQNEKGEPIADVKVTVNYWETSSAPNPHLRVNITNHEVSTDKDGRWRMDILPATFPDDGPRLFLSHPDYVSDHLQRGMTPMPVTERPSYESLQNQTAVMVMRKGGVIEGRVIDEAKRPIAGVRIYTEEHYWLNSRKPAAVTGEDGLFRIANVSFSQSGMNDPPRSTIRAWERHEVALVVQAAGYTPELIHTDPKGSASPLEISLKPGQAVQGRVVDESGKPIAGVEIAISNWLGYRSRLNLTTKTDADGKFQLTDAPLGGALYDFRKKGHMAIQDFAMSPSGQPEKEGYQITLKSPLRVAGSIVDAETKQPLAACTAIEGIDYDDGRAPEWQRFNTKTITDGRYEFEFASNIFCWRVRVEAEGYMPAVSRIFRPGDSDKGQVTYDFQLSKAAPMAGTVLGPDGKPLVGAEVFLATNLFALSDRKPSSESLMRARMARTDAAGRFELPPEVEPFYLVVLHDQGYAVINEKQFAESADVHVKPWTPETRNFRAERRPSAGARERPAAAAKPALTVRVVDEEGKPVEGAHVTTYTDFHASPNQFVPSESGWHYSPNIVSDSDGMARIADDNGLNCIVARHVERKLVAIQSVNPEQAKETTPLALTMHPQCVVSGKLTAKELEARNHKLAWSNVYVLLGEGFERPMSCMSEKADYHFYLPPGTFTLQAYATDTQHVQKTITVKPGQQELEVERIDLPPTGLILLEGKPAPELRDITAWKNGGPVKLSDLRGKAVILAFSSGWDGRGSIMPGLFPLYDKYRDQELTIVEIRLGFGLASDTEAQLEEKLAEVKKPFWKDDEGPMRRAAVPPPSLKDRDAPIPIAFVHMNRVLPGPDGKAKAPCAVVEDYGINGFPTGVLIDRQGRVVGRFDPRSEREEAALDPVLEKVLKEK